MKGAKLRYPSGQYRPNPRDLLQFLDLCPIEIDSPRSWTSGGQFSVGRVVDMGSQSRDEAFSEPGNAQEIL
ncbi:MAG: hypothetical protein E4H28_05565 [Gemmatimonadales bacterium]|nr:MAG: hypothetical protein E4H28_05565 [Gemmatimonadales bacterium]